jgi:FAD/FMN-containing dehydrogenase
MFTRSWKARTSLSLAVEYVSSFNLASVIQSLTPPKVAAIGVGGLTTGGGISFFSNQYGWACDNVASYEVVTASGIIVTASPQSYPDLYWALRGGGNNFGIVTKFELVTFPQGMMWGGPRVIAESAFPAAIKAFYNLAKNAAQDTNAAQILSFVYTQGQRIASAELEYAKPIANAPIFKEWMAVPSIQDNTGIRSLSELTINLNDSNPNGLRETYWAASFKLDLSFASFIKDVFFEEVSSFSDAAALTAAGTIQGITLPQLQHMAQNGGNPLGLSAADGPFILFNPAIMWSNPADDARILKATSNMIKRTVAEAKKRGLFNDYIYMNYASQFQAVIPSYGVDSQRKLKSIAEKYDPTGVFQDLQPGYFKLDGAPNSNMP